MKFFLLINIKMPTIVGILIFISRKNGALVFAHFGTFGGLYKMEKVHVTGILSDIFMNRIQTDNIG